MVENVRIDLSPIVNEIGRLSNRIDGVNQTQTSIVLSRKIDRRGAVAAPG